MKICFLVLLILFLARDGGADTDGCGEEFCVICRDTRCKCDKVGCGDDEKMSLKKLILHFLERAQKKGSEEDEAEDDEEDYKQVVRVLRSILTRNSCHNINEETSIRDMILTRLKILDAKCQCGEEPHEALTKKVLRLLLEKCVECNCSQSRCGCVWEKKTCEPGNGTYWFTTTEENLRREIPKKLCGRREGTCNARERGLAPVEDRYKCRRYIADESDAPCNEFSICTDCDSCQVVVLKGRDDIWLVCDGCRVINSPFVQFTEGGCPVKVATIGNKKLIKISAKYLQLNDFRPQKEPERCDGGTCPFLAPRPIRKGRRRRVAS